MEGGGEEGVGGLGVTLRGLIVSLFNKHSTTLGKIWHVLCFFRRSYVIRNALMRGRFCRSLTPLLVRFVTAGYAVRAPFKFSSKSIGFPRAKQHLGLIFSCENLTDIGQISLSPGKANHGIF